MGMSIPAGFRMAEGMATVLIPLRAEQVSPASGLTAG